MICSDPSDVEAIFRSENVAHRQAATLRSADVITFACAGPRAPESAASSTVQVEVLLHSSNHIRRTTLEAWLDPAQNPQLEKFEWNAIQTGKGHPYSRDPTVQQFLEGSALYPPVAGKRLRIDLAGPSGHSPKKCGRKTGYRKPPRPADAADAVDPAGSAAGAGPAAAADAADAAGSAAGAGSPAAFRAVSTSITLSAGSATIYGRTVAGTFTILSNATSLDTGIHLKPSLPLYKSVYNRLQ